VREPDAQKPSSSYERLIGERATGSPMSGQRLRLLALAAMGALGLGLVVIASGAKGPVAATVVAIAGFTLLACYVVVWTDLMLRVHNRLRIKPWSDGTRIGLWFLAFCAIPLITAAAIVVVVAVAE